MLRSFLVLKLKAPSPGIPQSRVSQNGWSPYLNDEKELALHIIKEQALLEEGIACGKVEVGRSLAWSENGQCREEVLGTGEDEELDREQVVKWKLW